MTNGDRSGAEYTPEALGMFPRYNVLNAIRVEVERLDPHELEDIEEMLDILLAAGGTAEDDFTRKPIGEIAAAAMLEEREAFCTYLRNLGADQLKLVERLPYRRVLDDNEAKGIWAQLSDRWSIEPGYWFPLAESTVPDIVAFQDRFFEEAIGPDLIHHLLRDRGVSRVWELREYGPEYAMDIELLDPIYNGAEGYWSSEKLDWIIYASHESSVTVGGWMLAEAKKAWPAWSEYVWASPFF